MILNIKMLKHLGNTSITSGVLQSLTLTNGVSFVTLTAPPTGIYILSFPPDLGTSGQVLTTNGAGQTSWTTVSGGGGGSVTSVAASVPSFLTISGSPITTTGTLAITYNAAVPLPTANGGTGLLAVGAANTVLTSNGTVLSWQTPAAPGTGTVTSVAASFPAFLTIAGSPITTTGTLAITLSGTALPTTSGGTGLITVGAAGTVLSSNGTVLSWTPALAGTVTSVAASVPSFLTISGSPITTTGTLAITYNAAVPLPIANGGTGLLTIGAANTVLSSNGTVASWQASTGYYV